MQGVHDVEETQPSPQSAGALAVRVMVGVWILYCLILTSAYTGNLKVIIIITTIIIIFIIIIIAIIIIYRPSLPTLATPPQ